MHVLYQSNFDQPASSLNLSVDLGGDKSSRSGSAASSSLTLVVVEVRVSRVANFSSSLPTPSAAFAIPILRSRIPFVISIDLGLDAEGVRLMEA
jgi:hypothetical protein